MKMQLEPLEMDEYKYRIQAWAHDLLAQEEAVGITNAGFPTENKLLTASFSIKEIREAIFGLVHNKAPGPDGFSAKFYQHFWDTIQEDMMLMFRDLSRGEIEGIQSLQI
ncbi:hypothetical protein ACJX0J_024050 [Zea mays]